MAGSEALKKSHFHVHETTLAAIQRKKTSKSSCSNIICKSLILIFVLVVIPLFPSQAPDFISQRLSTNFWELFHLLFVGIAVCYGLFCRKFVQIENEIHSGNDNPNSNFPGGFEFSSFFENGLENFCISDESKILNDYQESFYLDEDKKFRSFTSKKDSKNVCENVKVNGSQIRNLKYFKGETLVLVNDGNCEVQNGHKPLGLPIRSLRSGIADTPEFTTQNLKNSRLKISTNDNSDEKPEQIRGLAPSNLGKKFDKAATPSIVPWRSRSEKIDSKDVVQNPDSQSHCRLQSAEEFKFEHLESRVSSSRNSRKSSSSGSTSGSSSDSIVVSKPKASDSDTNKDLEGEASDTSSKSNGSSSIDSFSEMEMQQKSKYSYLNSLKAKQNQLGDANQISSSLGLNLISSNSFRHSRKNTMQDQLDASNSSVISSNLTKITLRAKSVRTIRSSKYVSDKMKMAENTSNQTGYDDYGQMISQVEEKQEHDSDKVHPLPNSTDFQSQIEDVQEDNLVSKGILDNYHEVSNEKETGLNEDDKEELVGSEVDRKADEFIAKFRKQIMLQKLDSPQKRS